jgi:ATP-dependent Lon protease
MSSDVEKFKNGNKAAGTRAEMLMQFLQKELQFTELKNKVTAKTRTELDKQQREYFLQQQLKSIFFGLKKKMKRIL